PDPIPSPFSTTGLHLGVPLLLLHLHRLVGEVGDDDDSDAAAPPPPAPAARTRFQSRSVLMNIPMMSALIVRRARELEDIVSEEEEEEEINGVMLSPHEVVASRNTPMLACSVLEGAGR
ncbi:hypothetical protein PHJA_003031800, partial [Phtheirospermum japonicum]